MGKKVFLSYAEEDSSSAGTVAERLKEGGFEVYRWQDVQQRGKQFISEMEKQIAGSQIFLALVSPDFLVSPWCKHEWQFALRCLEYKKPLSFLIARVRQLDPLEAGFIGNYDWFDLTGSKFDEGMSQLLETLKGVSSEPLLDVPAETLNRMDWPVFQNRTEERDEILDNLLNSAGSRFFVVLSGPQMGKTWLLQQIFVDLTEKDRAKKWHIIQVNLRDFASGEWEGGQFILEKLFNIQAGERNEETLIDEIVKTISRSKRSWLCMLDSAELLSPAIAAHLRITLSKIYREVRENAPDSEFAFIAASRIRHEAWRGILPDPRFRPIKLTHFSLDVIQKALFEMTQVDGRTGYKETWYEERARCLQGATEGLPALLSKYMQWIRENEYVFGADDLEKPELFAKLAVPYIESLLRVESLLLSDRDRERIKNDATLLDAILRELVVYRIMSVSCLEKVLSDDSTLAERVSKLKWKKNDLWDRILDTPLIEPSQDFWAKTYVALRRLLFRYWYDTPEKQMQAHFEAGRYYDGWWYDITGTDKAIVLRERLWHEIEYLKLSRGNASQAPILKFAKKLFQDGIRSNHITQRELSGMIEQRLGSDPELNQSLKEVDPHAFEKLIEIVRKIKG